MPDAPTDALPTMLGPKSERQVQDELLAAYLHDHADDGNLTADVSSWVMAAAQRLKELSDERVALAAQRAAEAARVRDAALEEAAKVCDERSSYGGPAQQYESKRCAEAIRALREAPR